jgi:CRISPR-associated endonuclease/helicase Cas3
MAFAHSKLGRPQSEWHQLEEHLTGTGARAQRFAESWGAGDWAYFAGLWHDLGKYAADFQAYIGAGDPDAHIETRPGRVNHSSAGAIHAMRFFGSAGLPLAFASVDEEEGTQGPTTSPPSRRKPRPLASESRASDPTV